MTEYKTPDLIMIAHPFECVKENRTDILAGEAGRRQRRPVPRCPLMLAVGPGTHHRPARTRPYGALNKKGVLLSPAQSGRTTRGHGPRQQNSFFV